MLLRHHHDVRNIDILQCIGAGVGGVGYGFLLPKKVAHELNGCDLKKIDF